MDNPNPIHYSDLIQPDNSITQLMEQLDALIAKYEQARSKIQGAAQQAAQSMSGLSGATKEQQEQIKILTEQTDKLAQEYQKTTTEERRAYQEKQKILAAQKEQNQIDKLLVQINNSKEGSYNRLSAQYRLNKIRLNEMSAAERSSTQAGRQLETETRKIYEEMSRLQKATGKYTLEVGHYENALRGLPGPIGQVVSQMSTMRQNISAVAQSGLPIATKGFNIFTTALTGSIGVLFTFTRALSGAAKTVRDFEQANANLASILGVSVKEMDGLINNALLLGRTTEYTASQVVQLQTELAKLGFRQAEIINMSKSVLQFATAVGAELGPAAEVAGSTLRAFGLSSKDAQDALGTLAVATTNSALNFEKIRTSIGTVFPVANAFGISLKDTTALLGALANAGFDASSAATATRNILLNLANANGKLAQAMGGPVKTFDEFITGLIELRDRGIDLNTTLELTDKRSVAAFNAFLSGAESARELRASLEEVSEELREMQEKRLDTVEGSIKLLKSAWEGMILAMGQSTGTIRTVVESLTALLNVLTDLLNPGQRRIQDVANVYSQQIENLVAGGATPDDVRKARNEVAAGLTDIMYSRGSSRKQKKQAEQDLKALNQAYDAYVADVEESEKRKTQAIQDAEEQATIVTEKEQKKRENAAKKAANEARRREEEAKKQALAERKAVVESINNEIAVTEKGTAKMFELRQDKINAQRQVELEENRQKTETARQDEAAINAKYDRMLLEDKKAFDKEVSQMNVQKLQAEQQGLQMQIAITEQNSEEMLQLRLRLLDKQMQIEIEQNRQKDERLQQDEKAIKAKYDNQKMRETADFYNKQAKRELAAQQNLAEQEFNLLDKNERQKTIFKLEQERARLEKILELDKTASERMTDTEVAAIKKTIEAINKEIGTKQYSNLFEVFGLGVSGDQQSALTTAIDSVKDGISSLMDSYKELAETAVESANKQVESAQKVLDAQLEAKRQGYANDVETAQKELDLARKNQQAALKDAQKMQKAQAALDSLQQASSLITATANLWKAFSGGGAIGIALAIASTALMWGSFAAAKVKAAQVTSESYGEGTVELLEGGSHASGNDIDLGRKKNGTRRRAEGGEFFAVINKRSSKKYRRVIPEVINALNDGTFALKYQRAGEVMAAGAYQMTDVSRIEREVTAIRQQGESAHYTDAQGREVMIYKNLTRRTR